MSAKMKECFEPHVLMHSLFGLGLGFLLSAIIPALGSGMLGILLMTTAVIFDVRRK